MDGFSVYVSGDQKTKSWFHIDQNPTNYAILWIIETNSSRYDERN